MLTAVSYVPLMKTKVAEVSAYRTLSNDVKDHILPIFLGRPWPHANHYQLTVDRVMEAVDGRPFGFGLDHARRHDSNTKAAQGEFDALFDSTAGYRAYYDLLAEIDGAIPVLQHSTQSTNLLLQLGNADDLDRGLIVHVTRDRFPPVLNIAGSVPPLPHDTIFLVDAGWSRNYELKEAWVATAVDRITSTIPNAELVICASSFPDSFSHIVGEGFEEMHERRLFGAIRQRFNQADVTYGDWGSTRLEQSGGGGEIPPRVDLATSSGWPIFRAANGLGLDYAAMAQAARNSAVFDQVPECYGKQMVVETPGEGGITGTSKNTRARINMHLTLHSSASTTIDTDDIEYRD